MRFYLSTNNNWKLRVAACVEFNLECRPTSLLMPARIEGLSIVQMVMPLVGLRSEADKLRQQLQKEREATEWQRARANQLEKSLTAQKGQMTKLKKRINNGVCPCCRRSFAALAQHMRRKHPDYVEKETTT